MKRIINRQSGFTLIEMLVTMTSIGIVLAIAAPNFSQWIERYRIDAGAQNVYFDLMSARATAVKNNNDVIVTFDSANNSYKVHDDTNGDGLETGETVKTISLDDTVAFGINGSPVDIDGNTITSSIFFGGGTSVSFDSRGQASLSGSVYLIPNGAGSNSLARGISITEGTGGVDFWEYDASVSPPWS